MAEMSRKSACAVVVDHVTGRIASGELKKGDKLPNERELSAQLNVSRVSLREALSSLSVAGIVEPRQGAGTYIGGFEPAKIAPMVYLFALLDGASLADVLTTRRVTEAEAASQAAAGATEPQKADVASALTQAEQGWSPETDLAFHLAVAAASGNVFLAKMLETAARCGDMLWRRQGIQPPDGATALPYYRRVADAIRAGDRQDAYSAMYEYGTWLCQRAE